MSDDDLHASTPLDPDAREGAPPTAGADAAVRSDPADGDAPALGESEQLESPGASVWAVWRARARTALRIGIREAPLVGLCALAGYAVAGTVGALVAGAAVIAGRLPSERPGAAVAMAAFVLLAGAALASVLEATPGAEPLSLAFPRRRELASDLGAAAGILLFAAVVTSALAERPPDPPPCRVAPAEATASRRVLLAGAVVGVVGFVVRLVAAPRPLPPELDVVVDSIAGGRSLVVPDLGLVAPAAPVVAAFWPGGGGAALVVVGLLVVLLSGRLADRLALAAEPPALAVGPLAAALVAVLPSAWLMDLPDVLVAAAVLSAVLLAEPGRVTPARALVAGLLAGTAMLARPEAVVVGPVLVLWCLFGGRTAAPTRRLVRAGWALAGGWLALLVLWARAADGMGEGWWPLHGLGPDVPGPGGGPVVLAVVLLSELVLVGLAVQGLRRRGPTAVRRLLPFVVLPVWAAAASVADGDLLGLLSWGAPLLAVPAAWELARLGPVQRAARSAS